MATDEFAVPDDLTELLGSCPAPPAPDPAPTPRRAGSAAAADLSGVAGGSTRAKLDRGRLLFGWRLNTEQRALRTQLEAEVHVGAILDRLTRIGARVLHDRVAPDGSHVDHVVISESGVQLVESIASSRQAPLIFGDHGAPRLGPFPLEHRLVHLHDVNQLVATQTAETLGMSVRFTVFPLAAVTGTPPAMKPKTCWNVDVVPAALTPGWIARLPAAHSSLVVAALTEAVARVCPPAK